MSVVKVSLVVFKYVLTLLEAILVVVKMDINLVMIITLVLVRTDYEYIICYLFI